MLILVLIAEGEIRDWYIAKQIKGYGDDFSVTYIDDPCKCEVFISEEEFRKAYPKAPQFSSKNFNMCVVEWFQG